MFDGDMEKYPYFWHRYGHHQHANYEALITSPQFDELIRHPKIYPTIEELMGGPLCFGEIGLRMMRAYDGSLHQGWHRDRPHWDEHPFRMDYIQLMVYLSDVDEGTHCFSISPEAVSQPVLEDKEEQLKRGGEYNLHGPAGTCALFNVAVLHTATTRPTQAERRTVQIYYGHRNRAPLANDSSIPAAFWRDSAGCRDAGFLRSFERAHQGVSGGVPRSLIHFPSFRGGDRLLCTHPCWTSHLLIWWTLQSSRCCFGV